MGRNLKVSDGTDGAEAYPDLSARWYALWVLSNAEFVIEERLQARGIGVFLPAWLEVTQWSDRKKTVRRPLFPGYLFIRCETRHFPAIMRLAGVVDILPSTERAEPIDGGDLEAIRRIVATGRRIKPCDFVQGDAVLIESGPLAGVKGIVQRTRNGTRVVVKIEMLKRAVSVEVDSEELQKAA